MQQKLDFIACDGPTKTDKTALVRHLVIQEDTHIPWMKPMLDILAKCLKHATTVFIGGELTPAAMQRYWKMLMTGAPYLMTLELKLGHPSWLAIEDMLKHRGLYKVFEGLSLPASVRLVKLDLGDGFYAGPLFRMLDERAPHLDGLYLVSGDLYFGSDYLPEANLTAFPNLSKKVRRVMFSGWADGESFISPKNDIRLVDINCNKGNFKPSVLRSIFFWENLETITLSGFNTSQLPELFSDLNPKVKRIEIIEPLSRLTLSRFEAVELALAERPELRVNIFDLGLKSGPAQEVIGLNPSDRAEVNFWKGRRKNVSLVWTHRWFE